MVEALLTAAGLVLAGIATMVGILHDDQPSKMKKGLALLAILGIGVGLVSTWLQYQDQKTSAEDAKAAKAKLSKIDTNLQQVGLTAVQLQTEADDLDKLSSLGDKSYYVQIATFKIGSSTDDADCRTARKNIGGLYPNAESKGQIWAAVLQGDPTRYTLRFGKNLTPNSAQTFWSLANHGLANGSAVIRREPQGGSKIYVAGCLSPT